MIACWEEVVTQSIELMNACRELKVLGSESVLAHSL